MPPWKSNGAPLKQRNDLLTIIILQKGIFKLYLTLKSIVGGSFEQS